MESDGSTNDFDVENYISENYAIDNMHYTTDTWENEDTGRTEYIVSIHPDSEELGQEIDGIFKNGSHLDDERTRTLFEIAEEILIDLPQINNKIHIESVIWKADEEVEFPILLIQDYQQSTIE
ncbi:hypothetical protein ACFSTA_02165 [Ornithinibacillus salinisoli]|uniref:Uncharacterized protein n=1 Tax=Ornithinibacillus salinisoli TaxID=1848459 RepID=A0ABW4VXT7_9BACI